MLYLERIHSKGLKLGEVNPKSSACLCWYPKSGVPIIALLNDTWIVKAQTESLESKGFELFVLVTLVNKQYENNVVGIRYVLHLEWLNSFCKPR